VFWCLGGENVFAQAKLFVKIKLCVLVSWWRKCFCTKFKEFTIKTLNSFQSEGFLFTKDKTLF
jgi:hypothetical protein